MAFENWQKLVEEQKAENLRRKNSQGSKEHTDNGKVEKKTRVRA